MRILKTIFWTIVLMGSTFLFGIIIGNYVVLPLLTQQHAVVEVPEVCGKHIDEAKKLLKEAGLIAVVDTVVADPAVPEGYVVSQNPLPTKVIKRGRNVHLVVSSGTEFVVVPYVHGLLVQEAVKMITESGLKIAKVEYIPSELHSGYVERTEPPSDAYVPKGTSVTILVSE